MNSFGSSTQKTQNGRTYDYEVKYPRDKLGEEMEPNARIWRVYNDETEAYDDEMYQRWKDTTDVLLVFTGLFSAVVTTFLAQASTSFSDSDQITASLMFEMIHLQRALGNGSSLASVAPSTLQPGSDTASYSDYWVNGLWLLSLILSLAAALNTLLVKQWLHYYMSRVSGTPLDHARVRHYRFHNLEKWHVEDIIELLPLLLHLSFFFFFIGLAVFASQLNLALSSIVIAIGAFTFVLYTASNILPTLYHDCPYITPLAQYFFRLRSFGESITIRSRESMWVLRNVNPSELVVWLHSFSANPTVKKVALQATAGLDTFVYPDMSIFSHPFVKALVGSSPRIFEEHSYEVENLELALLKLMLGSEFYGDTKFNDYKHRIEHFQHVLTQPDIPVYKESIHWEICAANTAITILLLQTHDEAVAEFINMLKDWPSTDMSIPVLTAKSLLLSYFSGKLNGDYTISPNILSAFFELFSVHLTTFASEEMSMLGEKDSFFRRKIRQSLVDALLAFTPRFKISLSDDSTTSAVFPMSQETIALIMSFIKNENLWNIAATTVQAAAWLLWTVSATRFSDHVLEIKTGSGFRTWRDAESSPGNIFRIILGCIEEISSAGENISEESYERVVWIRRVLGLENDDRNQIYYYDSEEPDSEEREQDQEVIEISGRLYFRRRYVPKKEVSAILPPILQNYTGNALNDHAPSASIDHAAVIPSAAQWKQQLHKILGFWHKSRQDDIEMATRRPSNVA